MSFEKAILNSGYFYPITQGHKMSCQEAYFKAVTGESIWEDLREDFAWEKKQYRDLGVRNENNFVKLHCVFQEMINGCVTLEHRTFAEMFQQC